MGDGNAGRRPYGRPRGDDRLVERRPMLRLEREGLPDERDAEERRTDEPRDRGCWDVRLTAERRDGVEIERRALLGWRLELLRPIDLLCLRLEPVLKERDVRLRVGLCPVARDAPRLAPYRFSIERLERDGDVERIIKRRGVVVPRLLPNPADPVRRVRSTTRPREDRSF